MTTGEKIGAGIGIALVIGLLVYFVGIAANWWKNPFKAVENKPNEPNPSEYEKCLAAEKLKANGEPCAFCIEPGHSEIYERGVIQNGKCVVAPPPSQGTKLRISNPKGAIIYDRAQNGTFSPRANVAPIPANTELVALYSDGVAPMYYGIRMGGSDPAIRSFIGWINSSDVQQRA